MKDLEDRLSESLGRQGASVRPASVPFDDVVERAHRTVLRRRAYGALAAAAVLVVGGVTVWSATRPDDRQVTIADDPAPTTTDGSLPAADGSWTVLPPAPLSPRENPSVVWTGSEFIVWGGTDTSGVVLSDGAAYDPVAGTWRSITPNSWGHPGASAVWDGTEMIVGAKAGGAAYDPVADSWRDLPSIDLGFTGGVGISQVVMAGDDVLAVGLGSPDAPQLRIWRLRDTGWEELAGTDSIGAKSWKAVGLPDGVAVWNIADGSTVQYRFGGRWSVHQQPELPDGASLAGDVELVWAGGLLRAVVPLLLDGGDHNATMIATLDGEKWSAPGPTIEPMFALTQTVTFGNDGVVLGGRFDGDVDPMLLDGATGTVRMLTGYPITNLIDQGVAASDDQLFVWGGQTNSPGEGSTDSSPVSVEGAIWTRSSTPGPAPTTILPATTVAALPTTTPSDLEQVGALGATPGTTLDLARLTEVQPPTSSTRLAMTSIQSAHLTLDGRFVITPGDGRIALVRPDGTVDDELTIPFDPGWSLVDAALGPLDVLYVSESSTDPETLIETFRFTAIPTTGVERGTRTISAIGTENCVETWCGQIEFGANGVGFSDLRFYYPPEFGAVDVGWPPLPTATAAAGDTGEMDPTGNVSELTEFVTVTMPDGSTREWKVRIPDTGIAEGNSGIWLLQTDGTVVGVAGSTDGRQYLVTLRADGSSSGIRTESLDIYAAFRGEANATVVAFRDGAVFLDIYAV